MSGKCKRIARHLLFLLWFSWRCKFAEVSAKSTTSKENKANNDLFTFWIRGLFTSAKLHDKLLWLIGGVVCVYTSQLNSTGKKYWADLAQLSVSTSNRSASRKGFLKTYTIRYHKMPKYITVFCWNWPHDNLKLLLYCSCVEWKIFELYFNENYSVLQVFLV